MAWLAPLPCSGELSLLDFRGQVDDVLCLRTWLALASHGKPIRS